MKAMDFLTLLGELDEDLLIPVQQTAPARRTVKTTKHRSPLKWVSAACICMMLLGFAAWFFIPPSTVSSHSYQYTVIRIVDRLASYRYVKLSTLSRYERLLLPDTPGELLATHGESNFYRAEGEDDLVYILQETAGGDYDLLIFDGYVSTVDIGQSYWYTSGWLTDEDIAALTGGDEPTMLELLDTIYSVSSAEDIAWIRFEKDSAYNDKVSKRVKVRSVTVTDREAIERLYQLYPRFHTEEYGQQHAYGHVDAHDEAYLTGASPLSAQVNREMVIKLSSGRELRCKYYPATGLLRQSTFEMYTNLTEAENQWLIGLAEIDMEWKDWGTEEPRDNKVSDKAETETVPSLPTKTEP